MPISDEEFKKKHGFNDEEFQRLKAAVVMFKGRIVRIWNVNEEKEPPSPTVFKSPMRKSFYTNKPKPDVLPSSLRDQKTVLRVPIPEPESPKVYQATTTMPQVREQISFEW